MKKRKEMKKIKGDEREKKVKVKRKGNKRIGKENIKEKKKRKVTRKGREMRKKRKEKEKEKKRMGKRGKEKEKKKLIQIIIAVAHKFTFITHAKSCADLVTKLLPFMVQLAWAHCPTQSTESEPTQASPIQI